MVNTFLVISVFIMSCLFQNNLQTKNISQWTMRSVSTHRRRMIQQTGTPRTSGKYCVYCTTAVLPTDGVRFSRQGRHRHQASTVCTVLPTDGARFSRQGRHRHQASTLLYYPQTEDDSADRDATDISKYCTVHTRTLYVLSKNNTVTKFVPLHVDPVAPPRQLHFQY